MYTHTHTHTPAQITNICYKEGIKQKYLWHKIAPDKLTCCKIQPTSVV